MEKTEAAQATTSSLATQGMSDEEAYHHDVAQTWATANDVRDMDALGLKPVFRRRFELTAMIAFNSIVVVAWQATLSVFYIALYNGGTGGLFWSFLFSIFGMAFVYLTIAELSSSFPTAGGQYQYIVECSPAAVRKILSYCTGWLVTLSWLTYLAARSTIIGIVTKICILMYHPTSAVANSQWFPTLIALVMLVWAAIFNISLAKHFPAIEGIMLVIHLGSWVAVIATLWATSPIGNARDVLLTFTNPGGWQNSGVATIIGVLTPWGSLIGYDSSVHMSTPAENAKDASRTIPLSLLWAYAVNSALALITAVTMIFCLGDVDSVLASFSPFVQVFLNSTGSKAGTTLLIVPIIISFMSALASEVATASRQLWSFARDGGLPAGRLLVPVPDAETPRRAVWATITLSGCIACINFGPIVGFNAIISLVVCALTFSYSIPAACALWRRFSGRGLPKGDFSLGSAGAFVNVVALCCALPVTVLSVFPPVPNPSLDYMNWAVVVFGVVVVVAMVNYIFSGRTRFNPPLRKEC